MSELRSITYWVGHSFTIIATVVGVYYAAVKGLDVGLQLEMVRADRGTYYVTESMCRELEFNVKNMEQYIEQTKDKRNIFKEHIAGINLNDFAYQAAKYSDSTFEIKPELLIELSIFYFSVGNALDHYYKTGMQSPSRLMAVVKREVTKLREQKTVEKLSEYSKAIAETVEARGMSLEQPN